MSGPHNYRVTVHEQTRAWLGSPYTGLWVSWFVLLLLCLPFFSRSCLDMCPVLDPGLSPWVVGSRVHMALAGVLWL